VLVVVARIRSFWLPVRGTGVGCGAAAATGLGEAAAAGLAAGFASGDGLVTASATALGLTTAVGCGGAVGMTVVGGASGVGDEVGVGAQAPMTSGSTPITTLNRKRLCNIPSYSNIVPAAYRLWVHNVMPAAAQASNRQVAEAALEAIEDQFVQACAEVLIPLDKVQRGQTQSAATAAQPAAGRLEQLHAQAGLHLGQKETSP
jgi:hypothetical protein